MKSKNFILTQIKTTMLEKGHYEADADKYVDEIKDSTVYELLVLKKEITTAVVDDAPDDAPLEEGEGEASRSLFDRLRGVVRYED